MAYHAHFFSQSGETDVHALLVDAARHAISDYALDQQIGFAHPASSDTFLAPLAELALTPAQSALIGVSGYLYSASSLEVAVSILDQGLEWRLDVALRTPSLAAVSPLGVADVARDHEHLCRKRLATVMGEGLGDHTLAYALAVSPAIIPLVPVLYRVISHIMQARGG